MANLQHCPQVEICFHQKKNITVTNRTTRKGERLAKEFNVNFIQWSKRESVKADVIINATSIGMIPNIFSSPISNNKIKNSQIGCFYNDTIFRIPFSNDIYEKQQLKTQLKEDREYKERQEARLQKELDETTFLRRSKTLLEYLDGRGSSINLKRKKILLAKSN